MLSMFKPIIGKKRKVLIDQINKDIKETFEETFAENYVTVREQLIKNGVPEEEVEEKLSQIKEKIEQKMIIKSRELLRDAVLEVSKEEKSSDLKESSL